MRRLRLSALVAMVAAIAMVAAACSSDSDDSSSSSSDSGDLTLVKSGELTVCSDIPYEPFEFEKEGTSGEYTGYDIELLDEIASDNSLDLAVRVTPFDGILGSVEAGDCDVVGSALTITEERAEQVDFSESYFDAEQSLLVKKADANTYAQLSDLAGQTIGVQSATTGEDYAKENTPEGATIRSFEGAAELFSALEAGEVQAILQDFPVNAYRATQDDTVAVTETFQTGEQYGFATKKDNSSLVNAINASLNDMRTSGKFDEIYAKWFGDSPDAGDGSATATPEASPTS